MRNFSTHSGQLERWLGKENVENLSKSMVDWYGPPIAVAGVPGQVYADKGGDFHGRILAGEHVSAIDRAEITAKAHIRKLKRSLKYIARNADQYASAGFASISDMVSEASTNSKTQQFPFLKSGPTGVASVTSTLWRLGSQPAAGAVGAAAPGGTVHTSANTGAFNQLINVSTDQQYISAGFPVASVAGNTLLLCDRLFSVAKTMASTTTEAVTGVPTRYTSTTSTAPDFAGGNFLTIEIGGTALAATGHNWTVCQYTNQAGTATQTLPSVTGNSGGIVDRLDQPASTWFNPLASGDTGMKALTQMQCSASVATGVISFVVSHPIAWMPCPIANMVCTIDCINTAFNFTRIFDNACLYFLEVIKPSTTATTYTGTFTTVWG